MVLVALHRPFRLHGAKQQNAVGMPWIGRPRLVHVYAPFNKIADAYPPEEKFGRPPGENFGKKKDGNIKVTTKFYRKSLHGKTPENTFGKAPGNISEKSPNGFFVVSFFLENH